MEAHFMIYKMELWLCHFIQAQFQLRFQLFPEPVRPATGL